MQRHATEPRPDWRSVVEQQGLAYWPTTLPSGEAISYWNEEAYYSVGSEEATEWEASVRILMEMLVEAGDFIVEHDLFGRLGLPQWVTPLIRETWRTEPPMLIGRFDFGLDADGSIKLLEYNCDTPAALLETAIQWHWLKDQFGEGAEQWNLVHEAVVHQLRHYRRLIGDYPLHVLYENADPEDAEEFHNMAYLAEMAGEAGMNTVLLPINQVGESGEGFVDHNGERIRFAYKMYPWDRMIKERYGRQMADWYGDGTGASTLWMEPIWKLMWSSKAILPTLWHLFPDHPNLLPAAFVENGRTVDPLGKDLAISGTTVHKPLYGFEGGDIVIVPADPREPPLETGPRRGFGEEGRVCQRFMDLGTYDGRHPVLGIWTVDLEPVALGIREHENLITDRYCRFVPHILTHH